MLVVGIAMAGGASAGDEAELVTLINAYRAETVECAGMPSAPAPPLTADRSLAALDIGLRQDPVPAARAAGYAAAKVQVIRLGGPEDTAAAMDLMAARHCRVLRDAGFSDVGVVRQGSDWLVALARPLLDDGLGDWRETGDDVLDAINEARSQSRLCGSVRHGAAPPLEWNGDLAQAALQHARDMAARNYFSHVSADGTTLAQRVDDTGYAWTRIGENIAAGSGSAAQVVAGWLESPGHCATLMNPEFTETGAAHAIEEDSDALIYWVQVFASPG